MTAPIVVCSTRQVQPRAAHASVTRSCRKSVYPELTLTAMREKSMGARGRRTSRICISAQLSLPPDSPTMTRSPSSISPNSVMARVTFLASRASRGVRYMPTVYALRNDVGSILRFS